MHSAGEHGAEVGDCQEGERGACEQEAAGRAPEVWVLVSAGSAGDGEAR